jgi:23S rRNA (cytidine1920-2'-O)/16S rRNA (cytidine1409-2'-O)-methyltransferase
LVLLIYFSKKILNLMRLDVWLVKNGLFETRHKAQMAIKSGSIQVDGQIEIKSSSVVKPGNEIIVLGRTLHYVSRGGIKLEKAIRHFNLDFKGAKVLDIGASTGGFTDCVLQFGASMVFAVDVGSEQLAPSLRSNPKVISKENMDFRKLSLESIDNEPVDIAVGDLSFISLTRIIPFIPPFLKQGGQVILLIKPQFELESRHALKKGIVKDKQLQEQAISRVVKCAGDYGLRHVAIIETDIDDPSRKNLEYLALFIRI